MKINKTIINDVFLIEPVVYNDSRGWFMETFRQSALEDKGIMSKFIQDNHSYTSEKGTIRGLHFQNRPHSQAKLVRCTKGAILDVAVDIRKGSDQYLQWIAVELTEDNKKELFIPHGFAHGFLTLVEDVEVQYKVDDYYSSACDRSIRFNDELIGVDWNASNPILSAKDSLSPFLKDSDCNLTIKVLVTGANGQLGYDVIRKLIKEGYDCKGVDINDFDITDCDATEKYIVDYNPYVVVHCSAYTAVDKAENDIDQCNLVNVTGTENIAKACKKIDAKMVYISTDYVYDGEGDKPFDVKSNVSPLNIYGKTKLLGEEVCRKELDKLFIIRTSWVFGINGNNFVKTMLKLAKERDNLTIVSDEIGSPTYTVDLAEVIFYLINTQKYGTYNASNEGYCSWYDFAEEIFRMAKINIRLNKIKSKDYKSIARRPLNSRLNKNSLLECGFGTMPSWKDALERYFKELKK